MSSQGAYINTDVLTYAHRLYQGAQQCVAQASGINYEHCPACVFGPCAVHVDGNMKLLTFSLPHDIRQQKAQQQARADARDMQQAEQQEQEQGQQAEQDLQPARRREQVDSMYSTLPGNLMIPDRYVLGMQPCMP